MSDHQQQVRLTASDADRVIDVGLEGELAIALEANPSTGYTWMVEELDPQVLQLSRDDYLPNRGPGDAFGGGGIQVLTFRVTGTGEAGLTLAYRRPWEERAEPLGTFSVQVRVS
jgi:inhibitor of cysteine peptidase